MKHRVVVTGLGIISPLGEGIQQNWEGLLSGQSAVKEIQSFDASTFPTRIAAEVVDFDARKYIRGKMLKFMPRPVQFALAAAHLAFADAGLQKGDIPPHRLGVFVGSRGALSDIQELFPALAALADDADESNLTDFWERGVKNVHPLWLLRTLANSALCHIAIEHDAQGANCNICNGEIGGCQAIEKAFKAIASGKLSAAIAGGYDSLVNWQDITEFSRYGLLTRRNDSPSTAVRPFDALRDGFAPSEGAAFVILEEFSHAQKRGAKIYGEILSAASNSSLPNLTSLYSSWDGLAELMERSLDEAGLNSLFGYKTRLRVLQEIDYINASGLATVREDIEEAKAINHVFGTKAKLVPISATKAAVGNPGVATGPMELIFTLLTLLNNLIPPMANYRHKDPKCDLNCVMEPLQVDVRCAMSINMGIGGQNAVIVVGALAS